jgi:hypothetical protein
MAASNKAVVQAYRDLYRHGLRAVQYSQPARFILRDRLRRAFRESPITDYEELRIRNTITFFKAAAMDRGMESKIIKNLSHVWFHETEVWNERNRPAYVFLSRNAVQHPANGKEV